MSKPQPRYCQECGKPLTPEGRFCAHCGSEYVPVNDAPIPQALPAESPIQGKLTWEASIGLLTNPAMLSQFALVLGGAGLVMALLLSFLMVVQGEWESIPMVLLMTLVGVGVLALLMLLVIVLFFGNRFRARFTIDEKGLLFETVDARAKTGSRLAALLGLLGGNMTTAGAGLMGMSREQEFSSWRAIASARYYPRSRTITLRNRWRTVALLACTPENYAQVAEFVRQRVTAPGKASAASAHSPLPRLLGRTALVVLAMLPIFLLPYPFELDQLVPLIMLCFALATVWLVHLFGWVVIACAVWIAAEIVLIGLEVKTSIFPSRGAYRNFEILDGADWLALLLAVAGLAYLVVFSWRAARGRITSALSDDYAEMDE